MNKGRKTDSHAASSSPIKQCPSTGSGQSSGQGTARVLGAILKSLAAVIIIALLGLQVVELGLILEKVSVLAGRLPPPPWEEEASISATPSPSPLAEGESEFAGLKVELLTVEADDEGLTLTLEVHQSGPAALFFEQPELQGRREKTYELDPDSLEAARFALLDVVTRGRAEIELRFTPAPDEGEDLTLIFNPDHPQSDPVAPRVAVPVRVGGE